MLIYADKIEEIKTICWCGRKATMVARVVDGKFVKSGEQILVGGDDMYVSLCRRHYNEGSLGPNGGRLTPVNTKFRKTPGRELYRAFPCHVFFSASFLWIPFKMVRFL